MHSPAWGSYSRSLRDTQIGIEAIHQTRPRLYPVVPPGASVKRLTISILDARVYEFVFGRD